MTTSPRVFVGFVLAAGLWFLSSSATAGTPDLPKDSYKKAAEADLAFLKQRLTELAKIEAAKEKVKDSQAKPAIGISMLLAVYADALGDGALRTDALKVAEAVIAKDYKGALELAKKMTVKPANATGKGDLPKLASFEKDKVKYLEHAMTLFRNKTILETPGGLHIQQDIRDLIRKDEPAKLDPAQVEILAVRAAVITEYATHYPNAKVKGKKDWEKWSKESVDFSKQITAEAAKGAKADEKKLRELLFNLNKRCNDCHFTYRDDE
ncbi:MAG: hypothetical protein L0241_04135 [Planctomycetia bacterium]|nr:hypothetical protein [Planctomycetia bacterium]